ncbi:MAG: HigA family addiction module antidote protein, partial [Bacteroidetes bacterium]|nr:HigA family addiction module antidote protein [Bacteroidota bacterium]
MSKKERIPFLPNEAIAPGEVLEEHIESIGMTQAELAERTGLTPKTINEIVNGKAPVTPETALKLERVLGRPAHFWNNLELLYQEDLVRLASTRQMQTRLA